jgi:hypothetical protein
VSGDKQLARGSRDPGRLIRTDWKVGLRNSAWDRLWHMIITDLGAIPEAPARTAKPSEIQDD